MNWVTVSLSTQLAMPDDASISAAASFVYPVQVIVSRAMYHNDNHCLFNVKETHV
uniref:Uncharacterized protein n=1 Tax=Arion vulgaris TaxID=1028688 RepID=A0A0B7B6B1_9EUPU